jgi:hypothetical protein
MVTSPPKWIAILASEDLEPRIQPDRTIYYL